MANLYVSAASTTSVTWDISSLGSAWNTTHYMEAILSSSPTTNDSTTRPSGVLSTMTPPGTGTSIDTPSQTTTGGNAFSAGNTYNLYGTMRSANGRYYTTFPYPGLTSTSDGLGVRVTMPSPPPPPNNMGPISVSSSSSTAPANITFSWSNPGGATYYELNGSYTNSNYTGTSYTFSNASAGTYSLAVRPWNAYGSGAQSSNSYTLSPGDTTSPTINSFSVASQTANSITVSASGSDSGGSGFSTLNFYISVGSSTTPSPAISGGGTPYGTTSINHTYPNLTAGYYYTVGVQARDGVGNSSTLVTIPNVRTVVPSESGATTNTAATGTTSYTWSISGLQNPFNSTHYMTAAIFTDPFTNDSATQPAGLISSTAAPASGTVRNTPTVTVTTGTTPGNTYTVYGGMRAANGRWYNAGNSNFTLRPNNFAWTTAKVSGGDFNILASEWNTLASTINRMRQYKSLSVVNFSTVVAGGNVTASHFNDARNAISVMSPPTTAPSTVTTGATIFASDINRLRDSLNSIS